ncbi:hypothetical protein CR513_28430, partial [Mucuna pruriens]
MLPGLKNAELEKCSHCMAGKHPPSRKSELLELVHSDVCGRLKEALGLCFEDKGPSVGEVQTFPCLVERQSGKKVKCIRFDNGGEYCRPFDGIKHEKTPPNTPQLNGLAERMNKTLIERVRCMLSEARLPKHFWGEALYTAVHVINLSPTVVLNIEVPDKIWFGKVRMPIHDLDTIDNNVQNGEQHNYGDQQLGDGFDVPLDDDAEEEQEMSQDENLGDALELPPVQLRRSNRQRQSSTRYTFDEYVTLQMEKNLNVTRSPWRVKKGKRLGNLNCRSMLLCPLPRQRLVLFRTNIGYSVIVRVQFILFQEGSLKLAVRSPDWRLPPHSCEGGDMLGYFWAPNYVDKSPILSSPLGLSYREGFRFGEGGIERVNFSQNE